MTAGVYLCVHILICLKLNKIASERHTIKKSGNRQSQRNKFSISLIQKCVRKTVGTPCIHIYVAAEASRMCLMHHNPWEWDFGLLRGHLSTIVIITKPTETGRIDFSQTRRRQSVIFYCHTVHLRRAVRSDFDKYGRRRTVTVGNKTNCTYLACVCVYVCTRVCVCVRVRVCPEYTGI